MRINTNVKHFKSQTVENRSRPLNQPTFVKLQCVVFDRYVESLRECVCEFERLLKYMHNLTHTMKFLSMPYFMLLLHAGICEHLFSAVALSYVMVL